ncbi:Uncharacterised protein [Mycobacterium tuberculosis]|nr:Uncharacterised protein [Mycobacterium tuberculosis]
MSCVLNCTHSIGLAPSTQSMRSHGDTMPRSRTQRPTDSEPSRHAVSKSAARACTTWARCEPSLTEKNSVNAGYGAGNAAHTDTRRSWQAWS